MEKDYILNKLQDEIIKLESNDELDNEFPFGLKSIPENFTSMFQFTYERQVKAKEFILREKKMERLKEKLAAWFRVLECELSARPKSAEGRNSLH